MCSNICPLPMPHCFFFPAKKLFLENPAQKVSPKLHGRSFGHTDAEIWRLKMSSTIRPFPAAHRFSFLQITHFWKAPTSGSHPSCISSHLVTPTQRSGG